MTSSSETTRRTRPGRLAAAARPRRAVAAALLCAFALAACGQRGPLYLPPPPGPAPATVPPMPLPDHDDPQR